jgi:hypothetical protein
MRFTVNKGGTGFTPLRSEPSEEASIVVRLSPDSEVESEGSGQDTPNWMKV